MKERISGFYYQYTPLKQMTWSLILEQPQVYYFYSVQLLSELSLPQWAFTKPITPWRSPRNGVWKIAACCQRTHSSAPSGACCSFCIACSCTVYMQQSRSVQHILRLQVTALKYCQSPAMVNRAKPTIQNQESRLPKSIANADDLETSSSALSLYVQVYVSASIATVHGLSPTARNLFRGQHDPSTKNIKKNLTV